MTTFQQAKVRPALRAGVVASAILLASCATQNDGKSGASGVTVSDKARLSHSGFLSDYERLKVVSWGDGIQCWSDPALDAKQYGQVAVPRIVVSLAPPKGGGENTIDPKDLAMLTDYFHGSIVKALTPQMQVVDQAGAGVVVMRIALTGLAPTRVANSVTGTLIPFGYVLEAGSGVATGRPAGSTPYLGETGMEMQFLDGATAKILAECRDTEIGRKYAADVNNGASGAADAWAHGYVSSFQAWSYAKLAFDKWSLLIAQHVAKLRGVTPAT